MGRAVELVWKTGRAQEGRRRYLYTGAHLLSNSMAFHISNTGSGPSLQLISFGIIRSMPSFSHWVIHHDLTRAGDSSFAVKERHRDFDSCPIHRWQLQRFKVRNVS